eukprot:TRINITY_DN12874_c0_g1_i6.p1 TRINITY_DN12874_c0_g1~~TRINITY_DN12874_c0_g1_i6.p1  ORF type:complete len:122 (+),score=29.97 TRINITY_DN12874_c0_g1_i6:149-514(+)
MSISSQTIATPSTGGTTATPRKALLEGELPMIKIMVIGDDGVGKSAIIRRFVTGEDLKSAEEDPVAQGMDIASKNIEVTCITGSKGVQKKDKVKLQLWHPQEIGRAVQQECRDRSRMPSSA